MHSMKSQKQIFIFSCCCLFFSRTQSELIQKLNLMGRSALIKFISQKKYSKSKQEKIFKLIKALNMFIEGNNINKSEIAH